MTPKKEAFKTLANTMIKNFAKRGMEAYYCEDSAAAVATAMELMKNGGSVGMGGTETVKEAGLLDAVKACDNLKFIDKFPAIQHLRQHRETCCSFPGSIASCDDV